MTNDIKCWQNEALSKTINIMDIFSVNNIDSNYKQKLTKPQKKLTS